MFLLTACGGSTSEDGTTADNTADAAADIPTDEPDAGGADTEAPDSTPPTDTTHDTAAEPDSAPEPLRADAGDNLYTIVGTPVTLSGANSTGASTFVWDPGDGSAPTEPSSEAEFTVSYDRAGRYRVVLTVENAQGQRRTDDVLVTAVNPPVFEPATSSTIALAPDEDRVAVVVPEANTVTVASVGDDGLSAPVHIAVCMAPRTLAWLDSTTLITVCQEDDRVAIMDLSDEPRVDMVDLPYGARPYGVLAADGEVWITFQGRGELVRLALSDGGAWEIAQRFAVVPDARGLTRLPDGRLMIARWRSPATHGELAVVDRESEEVVVWQLPFVEVPSDSDTENGGVPTWLDTAAVTPDGALMAVPALLANINVGVHLSGEDLSHETTVRAIVFWLDPATGEVVRSRKQFDDRGFAAAATFNNWGDFLFVITRGSRAVERLDRFNGAQSGSILNAGYAPSGMALTSDGQWLLVDASLSRELRQYDLVS
ncbi:MAG: PKD domain-containing protein, partial [Myxococcota bacterium]